MATSWQVTRQAPDQYDPDNLANPVTGVIVYFQTGQGNEGSVFIPYSQYTPAHVKTAINARARVADEIGNLAVNG